MQSIAIDGPSGAGKSTVAKILANRLGFSYLDTGAMYRAITLHMMQKNINLQDEKAIVEELNNANITFEQEHVFLNGIDVTEEIRNQEVTSNVSLISSYRRVREHLVRIQKELSENCNCVVDGRDIGTVVLPNATIKFFLTASAEKRAYRRLNDCQNLSKLNFDEIKADIERRDYLDSHRKESPLVQANDAIVIDSSCLSIDEVVDKMVQELEKKEDVL